MRVELNENNLTSTVLELRKILSALSLSDNFKGFMWEGEIAAGNEASIRNGIRTNQVPGGFIILSCTPVLTLVKGDTEWNSNYVFLKNISTTSTVKAKVFFVGGDGR